MHVVFVPVPRAHGAQKASIRPTLLTERLLDRRMDEDAGHARIAGGQAQQLEMLLAEALVDLLRCTLDERRKIQILALRWRQGRQIEAKEDIYVEADLVARMRLDHRPALGLAHIADRQKAKIRAFGLAREDLHETHELGMTVVAIAGEPHGLITGTVWREALGTD